VFVSYVIHMITTSLSFNHFLSGITVEQTVKGVRNQVMGS
jgi:hypothetical protein